MQGRDGSIYLMGGKRIERTPIRHHADYYQSKSTKSAYKEERIAVHDCQNYEV
jgi:hypothetical protein|tara:strand:- start:224 stop:382 length:159 start_codon:yes stop_codon:yes gene_type:complete